MTGQAWMGLLMAGMALAASAAAAAGDGALDRHRWRSRLIVIAADAGDPRVTTQKRIVDAAQAGMRERDLVVVEAIGTAADAMAIRRTLGLPERGFNAVLVGKDGGPKLVETAPIAAARLFETIDAMPMRRAEEERR